MFYGNSTLLWKESHGGSRWFSLLLFCSVENNFLSCALFVPFPPWMFESMFLAGDLEMIVMQSLQGRQVALAAVTVKQKEEGKVLMGSAFSTTSWIQTRRGWAELHWEINILWVHLVMKLRFTTHPGCLYLNTLNKNNHIIVNLYMIRSVHFHSDLWYWVLSAFSFSPDLNILALLFAPITNSGRFQILHLSF